MKRFQFLQILIIFLILGSLSIAYSQNNQNQQVLIDESTQEGTIKISSFLVNVPLIVSDSNGRYLPELKKDDFDIFENNVAQEVAFFSNEHVPTYLILIVDCSGSTDATIGDIRGACKELIKNLKDQDQAMIISFADNVVINQPFTYDKTKLISAVDTLSASGSTKLYDSVYLTARNILPQISGRKAIVLLTDGQDTTSNHNRQEAIDQLTESGTLAYAIQYPTSLETEFVSAAADIDAPRNPLGENADLVFLTPGDGELNRSVSSKPARSSGGLLTDTGFLSSITEVTGGRFYKSSIGNLSVPMQKIGEELRNVYVLSYYPSNPIDKKGLRKIKIKLNKKTKASVRYRGSYDAGKIIQNKSK